MADMFYVTCTYAMPTKYMGNIHYMWLEISRRIDINVSTVINGTY